MLFNSGCIVTKDDDSKALPLIGTMTDIFRYAEEQIIENRVITVDDTT